MKRKRTERWTLRGRGCVSVREEQAWPSLGEDVARVQAEGPMINARPRLASKPEKMREI